MIIGICVSFIVVREERGPYSDPQHPYFYEEEDVWMAPGFINQFYEVSYDQLFMTAEFFLLEGMKMKVGSVIQS